MSRSLWLLLLAAAGVSFGLVQGYSVAPRTAAWSGWTSHEAPNNRVSQLVTCNWDHLGRKGDTVFIRSYQRYSRQLQCSEVSRGGTDSHGQKVAGGIYFIEVATPTDQSRKKVVLAK